MNKLKIPFFATILTLGLLNSCGTDGCTDPTATNYNSDATKDDGSCEFANTEYKLSGTLAADQTLDASVIWTLEGRVIVPSGVTLSILEGTIIKAKAGTGANASSLVIARGGKLMAEGTASSPIIMTSESDDIAVGQTSGSSLTENVRGLW